MTRRLEYDGQDVLRAFRDVTGLHAPGDIAERLGVRQQLLHDATGRERAGLAKIAEYADALSTGAQRVVGIIEDGRVVWVAIDSAARVPTLLEDVRVAEAPVSPSRRRARQGRPKRPAPVDPEQTEQARGILRSATKASDLRPLAKVPAESVKRAVADVFSVVAATKKAAIEYATRRVSQSADGGRSVANVNRRSRSSLRTFASRVLQLAEAGPRDVRTLHSRYLEAHPEEVLGLDAFRTKLRRAASAGHVVYDYVEDGGIQAPATPAPSDASSRTPTPAAERTATARTSGLARFARHLLTVARTAGPSRGLLPGRISVAALYDALTEHPQWAALPVAQYQARIDQAAQRGLLTMADLDPEHGESMPADERARSPRVVVYDAMAARNARTAWRLRPTPGAVPTIAPRTVPIPAFYGVALPRGASDEALEVADERARAWIATQGVRVGEVLSPTQSRTHRQALDLFLSELRSLMRQERVGIFARPGVGRHPRLTKAGVRYATTDHERGVWAMGGLTLTHRPTGQVMRVWRPARGNKAESKRAKTQALRLLGRLASAFPDLGADLTVGERLQDHLTPDQLGALKQTIGR